MNPPVTQKSTRVDIASTARQRRRRCRRVTGDAVECNDGKRGMNQSVSTVLYCAMQYGTVLCRVQLKRSKDTQPVDSLCDDK